MVNDEQPWDSLYDQKAGELKAYFQILDDPMKRGFILGALESIVRDMKEGKINFTVTGTRDRKNAGDYMNELDDSETAEKIRRILDNPDSHQIKSICEHGTMVKIGRSFGISTDAIRQTKRRLLVGKAKSSYVAAQFAHWLLQNGYNIGE